MKKSRFILLLLFTAFLFFVHEVVYAKTIVRIIVPVSGVRLREEPTSSSKTLVEKIPVNTIYELVTEERTDPSLGCTMGWYHVYYEGDKTGYVCANFADEYSRVEYDENVVNNCETDLKVKGFPESYIPGLCELKKIHPTWNFTPDFNNLDWGNSVFQQEYDRKALIQSFNEKTQGFLDTEYISYDYLKDEFIVKEGTNWYNASHDTVAYFLDPRNFFDEQEIFIFEKLSFDETAQKLDTVNDVLKGTDIAAKSSVIYDAGKSNNVSPVYLASRIKLETTGNYTNYSIRGTAYGNYPHIYNPYNIGAYTGAADGIKWAAGSIGYGTPWTTLDTAINGGAQYIAAHYVGIGQDTTYFQKYNVSSYRQRTAYTNQYQTNVQGPAQEAISTYKALVSNNLLETAFSFVIPVYANMPETASPMPTEGNPNNHLKSITVNGKEIQNFKHDTFTYDYYVAEGLTSVKIAGSVINKNAKLEGTGDINLTGEKTTVTLKVTAQNKKVQNYTINIIRTDGTAMSVDDILNSMAAPITGEMLIYGPGLTIDQFRNEVNKISATASVVINNQNPLTFSTGDTVTISNGADKKTLNIAVRGDVSGDGNIDIKDLLKVQKYILGYSDLPGVYFKGGDNNQDGIVNIKDLLRIQKHILGYLTIN